MHPSHPVVIEQLEEDHTSLLKEIKCPQFFLPANGDHPTVRFGEGSLGKQVLGDALDIVEFPDMQHGWTIRGDMSDPVVERDVKKAFNLTLAFFKRTL